MSARSTKLDETGAFHEHAHRPHPAAHDRTSAQRRPRRSSYGATLVAAMVATLTLGAAAGAASADDSDCNYSGPPQWIAAVGSVESSQDGFSTDVDQPTFAETALTGAPRPVAAPESGCL